MRARVGGFFRFRTAPIPLTIYLAELFIFTGVIFLLLQTTADRTILFTRTFKRSTVIRAMYSLQYISEIYIRKRYSLSDF